VTESGSSYLLGKPEDVSTAREAVAERKAATITNFDGAKPGIVFKNGPHSLGYLDKTNMSSRRSVGSTIARVYATAGVGVAIAAYGSHIHFRPSSAPGWMPAAFTTGSDYMTIAQIVFALLLNYSCRAPFILRFGLFSAVAYSAGLNVGTWIHMALVESGACPRPGSIEWFLTSKSKSCSVLDSTILIAFIYTAGIYFCFSAAALLGNRNNKVFMYVSSILFAGSWVMWGSYLLARFGLLSDAVFDAVYIKMGLILYSLKVWYDTYAMVSKLESSSEVDVLDLALNALLNFLQIFIRVIQFVEKVRQKTRK
jgi:hypothetical protein